MKSKNQKTEKLEQALKRQKAITHAVAENALRAIRIMRLAAHISGCENLVPIAAEHETVIRNLAAGRVGQVRSDFGLEIED